MTTRRATDVRMMRKTRKPITALSLSANDGYEEKTFKRIGLMSKFDVKV